MKLPLLACWLSLALTASLGADPAAAAAAANTKSPTLRPFASEREFRAFVANFRRTQPSHETLAPEPVMPMPAPMLPAPPASAETGSYKLDVIQVTGTRIDVPTDQSITNVQTEGVDEGDIVKKQGDYLIVLRRGRLFTVRIGGDELQPVSSIDAFAPNSDPNETWYDEMLVSRDTVVVIGYSYDRGGTEVGVFDLTAQGQLKYRDTYQLRSNDYYSARNYASRLVGRTLIFYSPLQLYPQRDLAQSMPALRHWRHGSTPADFKRILLATRIYRSAAPVDYDDYLTLHTVASCDLDAQPMRCTATAVLGPASRSFYVSQDSIYIWTSNWESKPGKPNAAILRIPLDGAAPTGLRASGSPWDQMSFLQRDGWLNVLVGSQSDGEGMWASRSKAGELALLRVRLSSFGDGRAVAARKAYRALPEFNSEDTDLHARFIGDWLVYGGGENWRDEAAPMRAYALRYADNGSVATLALKHQVERVDALGKDAVLAGGNPDDGHLYFTSVGLDRGARVADSYVQRDARQGDERTHGFFYRAQDDGGGILGLPVLSDDNSDREQASVLFLRNRRLSLSALGRLSSKSDPNRDDGCKVSCVDWYGNARPIFIGERVFALLGYELVEGRDDGGRIRERRRTDFSPRLKVSP